MSRKKKRKGLKLSNLQSRILAAVLAVVLFFLSPAALQSVVNESDFKEELILRLEGMKEFVTEVFHVVKDSPYDEMLVHYIDVGQGDATLIQVNNYNLLIDTGEAEYSQKLINYLKSQGVKQLDAFIITHPHSDHMGGSVKILNAFEIKKLYMTNYVHTTRTYENLLKEIKKLGLKITRAKKGVEIPIGEDGRAVFLAPDKDYKDINASSAVLKLEYGRTGFMFSGDATKETERDIMKNYPSGMLEDPLKVNVYKVAHHGSSTSNGGEYMKRLSPEISVISLGKGNSYGHPHKEVMALLKDRKQVILRTDALGTIVVSSDGETITYQSDK